MKRTKVSGQVVASVCVRWYVNYSHRWSTVVTYEHVHVPRTDCGAPNAHFVTALGTATIVLIDDEREQSWENKCPSSTTLDCYRSPRNQFSPFHASQFGDDIGSSWKKERWKPCRAMLSSFSTFFASIIDRYAKNAFAASTKDDERCALGSWLPAKHPLLRRILVSDSSRRYSVVYTKASACDFRGAENRCLNSKLRIARYRAPLNRLDRGDGGICDTEVNVPIMQQ